MNVEREGHVFASTKFGTVTENSVVYYRGKGWFSGGSREDIPIRQITSIRIERRRRIWAGIILGIIGIVLLSSMASGDPAASGVGLVIGGVCIVGTAFMFWGVPVVVVNTAGQDLTGAIGYPWDQSQAEEFAQSVRSQLTKIKS